MTEKNIDKSFVLDGMAVLVRVRSGAGKWRNPIRGTNDFTKSSSPEWISSGLVDYERECSAELILAPNGDGCQHQSKFDQDQYNPEFSKNHELDCNKSIRASSFLNSAELRTKRAALKTTARERFLAGDDDPAHTTEQVRINILER